MIDSHCHLDHEPLYEKIDDVLVNAKNVGITKLLTICTTVESFTNILKIIEMDKIIYGTFGIHPHEADKNLITMDQIYLNIKSEPSAITKIPSIVGQIVNS